MEEGHGDMTIILSDVSVSFFSVILSPHTSVIQCACATKMRTDLSLSVFLTLSHI